MHVGVNKKSLVKRRKAQRRTQDCSTIRREDWLGNNVVFV